MSHTITPREVARLVIGADAVFIDTTSRFVWSSGLLAPLYCDHRLLIARPDLRRQLSHALAALILDHFNSCEAVAGVALAAVPWAAWVAELLV